MSKIQQTSKIMLPLLRKYGVVRAGIFVSFARGKATKKSDIDILVQFKGRRSLFDLVRLERELKSTLKKEVDLLTYKSIHPLLKDRILKEEIRIL